MGFNTRRVYYEKEGYFYGYFFIVTALFNNLFARTVVDITCFGNNYEHSQWAFGNNL